MRNAVKRQPLPLMEELEPRVLFSAGFDVVLIDSRLDDADLLREASQLSEAVVLYDSQRESAAELLSRAAQLAGERGERIESLSILSHGSIGSFQLGSDTISLESLALSADAWRALAGSMTEGANIYLYGCNVGEGAGVVLLDRLAELTGRDVFASDNLSGAGGDWLLESASQNSLEELRLGVAGAPLDAELLARYTGVLAQPVLNDQSFTVLEKSPDDTLIGTVSTTPVWANTEWEYRKTFTVDRTKVDGTQTDFPVWISLASDADLAARALDNGYDIFFADANGNKLAHDIELFDGANGKLQAWVRVPVISSSADTKIYMYYGAKSGAATPNQENPAGVWDANYVGIWHLNETSTSTASAHYQDGGSGDLDATLSSQTNGSASAPVSGKLGGGIGFDTHRLIGTNEEFLYTGQSAQLNMTEGTMQAWIRLTDHQSQATVLEWRNSDGTYGRLAFGRADSLPLWLGGFLINSGDLYYEARVDGDVRTKVVLGNETVDDGNWHQVSVTWDRFGARLSVDGGAFVALTSGDHRTIYSGTTQAQFGSENDAWLLPQVFIPNAAVTGFDGQLDEVRYSNVARSQSWLKTEYRNQVNPSTFMSLGTQERYDLSYSIIAGDVDGFFRIDATSGRLYVDVEGLEELDHEVRPQYQLTVKVTSGALSDTAIVTINIADVNEYDPVVLNQTFAVSENAAVGQQVGVVVADDQDTSQTRSYAIIGGNSAGVFAIDAATGRVTVANPATLNASTTPTYTLTVEVKDHGGFGAQRSDTAQITIQVTANNYPTVTPATYQITEGVANGTVLGTITAVDPDTGAGWANSLWQYRKALTIDDALVSATLTDFPLLVSFPMDDDLRLRAQSSGNDIFFTAADGVTKLAHQIEKFDVSNGQLIAWVRVPTLSASADTRIFMYYGNAGATNQQNASAVWSNGYGGVWHLNETVKSSSVGYYKDSSSTGAHLTLTDAVGSATPTPAGHSAGAMSLTDSADVLNSSHSTNLGSPEGTMEAWIKYNASGTRQSIVSRISDFNSWATLAFDTSGRLVYESKAGIGPLVSQVVCNTSLDDGQWHHVSVTWGPSGAQIRVDFDAVSASITGNERLLWGSGGLAMVTIGDDSLGNENFYGVIDEVRISTSVRSDDWLRTQYYNQSSTAGFITTSAQQTVGGSSQTISYAITGGNPGNAFSIDSTTGQIRVNNTAAIDSDLLAQYTLTVTVSDSGTPSLSSSAQVTIHVADYNDNPTIAHNATFGAGEDSPPGTVIGQVQADDADRTKALLFDIIAGNADGIFAIDANTGEVIVLRGDLLDNSVTPQHSLTVRVRDVGPTGPAGSTICTITVNVADANRASPVVTPASFSIDEHSADGTVVGSVLAVDGDAGQTLSYAISDGDPLGIFHIDPATGQIRVADSHLLDYERQTAYTLTVTVTDSGLPPRSGSATVTIAVRDVNEYDPVVLPAAFTISERTDDGTVLGTVYASDTDRFQTRTYRISAGDPDGIFEIDASSGELRVRDGSRLDFETVPVHVLSVTVDDSGTPSRSGSTTVTIQLTDHNEYAPVVTPATFSIAENAANDTLLGRVDADDLDDTQTLTYSISAGDPTGIFRIDPATGEIFLADGSQLDFETVTAHSLTVTVTDSGTPARSGSATVTIGVTDHNEFNPVVTPATFAVLENAANGTVLGSVLATDLDPGVAGLSYAITGGPLGIFHIDPSSGQISLVDRDQLDHETTPQITLTVTVTDSGGLTGSADVTIDVGDWNEHAPVVTPATFAVLENAGLGTVLGRVLADDADSSQTLTYAITGGDPDGIFAIDPATGHIRLALAGALDHETVPQFSLTVTVTDSLDPKLSGTGLVTIDVGDWNEHAPVVVPASFSIVENAGLGTVLGNVLAMDADSSQTLTYAITGGDPGGIFAIDPVTGQIRLAIAGALDHETVPQFTLTVTATDSLAPALSGSATVTIDIGDWNEHAPVVVPASFSIVENAGLGTVLGNVLAMDADSSQTLTYAITGGDPDGIFAIDPVSGQIRLAVAGALDHETAPLLTLTVTVTDSLDPKLSGTGTVTITVGDWNEHAPIVVPASFSIVENADPGTVLGSVIATDADSSQTLSYAITGGDPDGIFAIDPVTGQIRLAIAGALDHETMPRFTLTVTATDSLAPILAGSATVTIDIGDWNEHAPVVVPASFSVLEDAGLGTVLGRVLATDADSSQTLTYAITAGDPDGLFSIDPLSGHIRLAVADALDHETAPQFTLTVTVTDSLAPTLSGSASVVIDVRDANEYAPVVTGAVYTLAENQADDTALGTIVAIDGDTSQTLSYAISAGNERGIFAIDPVTGAIRIANGALFDHESAARHTLTVTATDDLGPYMSGSATVIVNVTDVNEFDPIVRRASMTIALVSSDGERLGRVIATDKDTSQTLSFEISDGDPGGVFRIDPATGVISLADSTQLVSGGGFTLTITVRDNAHPERTGTTTVSIQVTALPPSAEVQVPEAEPEPAPELPAPGPAPELVQSAAPVLPVEEELTKPTPARPPAVAVTATALEDASPRARKDSDNGSRYRQRALEIPVELLQVEASQLEEVHRDMETNSELVYATAQFSAATLLISAGALSWLLRSGSLVSSLMMSLPAWLRFDPLMVLSESGDDDELLDADAEFQTWLETTELEDVFEAERAEERKETRTPVE